MGIMNVQEPNRRSHALRKRWYTFAGALVVLIGAAFRLIALHDVPPGLAPDEVVNADIVTAILNGEHALFFRQGYGHEPLYHYFQTPFRVLLGDNVLSIRLPAVYLGLLLIATAMLWIRRDFGTTVGLVAGLGIAISWWPIVFSRIGIRPILEPVLLVVTAWYWNGSAWVQKGNDIDDHFSHQIFFPKHIKASSTLEFSTYSLFKTIIIHIFTYTY